MRSAKKGPKHILEVGDRDDNTDYTHQTDRGLVSPTAGYFADSDSANNIQMCNTISEGQRIEVYEILITTKRIQSFPVPAWVHWPICLVIQRRKDYYY